MRVRTSIGVGVGHRAVSGIIAAIMLFAALFATAGSLLLFVNASNQTANQANAGAASARLQASQEKLAISAGLTGAADPHCPLCLWLRANNTGGVSSTIIDVYVTCLSNCTGGYKQGQLLSSSAVSPGSHFLKGSPDINVTLPLSLNIGASTKYEACLPKKCTADVTVSNAAFTYPYGVSPTEVVVVSVLTSRGNVFSTQYPPPRVTSVTYITSESLTTSESVMLVGGGPELSVLLSATALCPNGASGCTQTFSCTDGCITVTATVYNLATAAATGVSFSLHTPYSDFVSGTASVTAYSACSPSSQNINPSSTASFICTFSASTGQSGGLAAFSGHATGTLYGVSVTSAEALSNSIEIGGLASVPTQGAFVPNFFFLKYSSCYQNVIGEKNYQGSCTTNVAIPPTSVSNLPSGSYIAGGANFYVAWYAQITNVFNTTVPILQYSYTYGDPTISGEVFYFLAGSTSTMSNGVYYPNYGVSPPTLTGYPTDCNKVNAQNVPTDTNCIYVNPGQTVTLTFAACGYGAKSWAWGGQQDASSYDAGSSGCTGNAPNTETPEGVQLGLVVSFSYKNQNYTELMPFQGQAYLRSAATSVSCSPSSVGAGSPTTCTVTVTDTDGRGTVLTPTGTVSFSGQATSLGTFSSTSCTLSSGSCSVTYTPYSTTHGTVSMLATYSGDYWHMGSSGPTSINVVYPSTTSVTCTPGTVTVGTATTCTVTVTGHGTPTGTVSFTSSGHGVFTNNPCTLGSSGSCSVTYTPHSAGSQTITASYSGDSNNGASTGSFVLTVSKANPTIATSLNIAGTTPTMDPNSASYTIAHAGGTPSSVSTSGISTTNPNDVIYACAYTESTGLTYGISDTSGLTWTARGTVSSSVGGEMECWYAVSSSTLSGDVVTVQVASGTNSHGINLEVFSVSGANTASPFDPNLGLAVSAASTSSGTSSSVPITTTNGNDLIVGVVGLSGLSSGNTITGGGSFTLIGTSVHGSASSADEYESVSTPQTGLGVGFTFSSSSAWVTMADAFTGVPPSSSTIILGNSARDNATLSGAYSPTGSVTFTVYSSAACTTQVFTSTNAIRGSSATSGSFTPSSTGTYYWEASYQGDSNNTAISSVCGASGETLTVNPAAYSVTFDQSGIPTSGVTWGVTVGGTDHTGTGSSITVNGIIGTSSYSYDSPVAGATGVRYSCSTGCSGTLSGAGTESATFVTQYQVSFAVSPSGGGTVSPSSTSYYTSGSVINPLTATPNSGYLFSSWSASTGSITFGSTTSASTTATIGGTGTITANFVAISVSVTCTPNPDAPGTSTLCTASVTPSTLSGTISWGSSGSGTFSTSGQGNPCTLSSGSCSVDYTPASGSEGTQTITGTYSGGGSGTYSLSVETATTTTVSCSPSSISYTGSTTCTVNVANGDSGYSTKATGTVTFTNGPTGFPASCTLSSGSCSASFTSTSGKEGSYTITASYSGDTTHESSSGTGSLAVYTTTTTTVSCSPSPGNVGTSETCTVTVTNTDTSYSTQATGTVTFSGTLPSGMPTSCALSGGTCSATWTPASGTQGSYSISASYPGDTTHASSSSSAFALTINKAKSTTTTAVSCTPTSFAVGGTSTCTATVSGYTGSISGETITWSQTGGTGSVTFSATTCTLPTTGTMACSVTVTGAALGSVTVKASYPGDSNNAGSSGTASLNVKHVQFVEQTAGVSKTASPFTCSFTSNGGAQPVVGNLIVVSFTVTPSGVTVSSVKDNAGNSLSLVASATESSSAVTMKAFMYAEIVPSGDSTSSPITITLSGTTLTQAYVTCAEWSGVLSSTPVQTATNQGISTTGTINILLSSTGTASSITPATGDLVYAYAGYSNCGTTSGGEPSYASGWSSGGAWITSGSYSDGSCGSSNGNNYNYRLNDGDQYVNAWTSGSTTAPFTVTQNAAPTTGAGSGWVEIVVEFDPPAVTTPAASLPNLTSTNAGLTAPLEAGPLGIASLVTLFAAMAIILIVSAVTASPGALVGGCRRLVLEKLGFPRHGISRHLQFRQVIVHEYLAKIHNGFKVKNDSEFSLVSVVMTNGQGGR